MTDTEFLDYCETHSYTPRCGFVPVQIARLLSLAGDEIGANNWFGAPNQIVNCQGDEIRGLVATARERGAR